MNNWENTLKAPRMVLDGMQQDTTGQADIEEQKPLSNQEKRQQLQNVKAGLTRSGRGLYKELIDECIILMNDARSNPAEAKNKLGLIRQKIAEKGIPKVKE